jgi:ribose/xylose/arabinose/galactoside ABC-type transport system permease subunit
MSARAIKKLDIASILTDRRVFLIVLILLVGALMSLLSPYFLRVPNLLDMTQFGAVIGLLALGQTLVILGGGGGIDLSVGASLSLSGVLMGLLVTGGVNVWGAALLALLIGMGLGAVNGFFVSVIGLPPFITTLGTLYGYSSLALVLAGGTQITGFDDAGFKYLGQAAVFGVPNQILVVLLPAYLVVGAIMAYTTFGRNVYEVGNNDRAASLVGVSPNRVRFALYCVSGLLAGVGAVVTNSWLLVARPGAGDGLELQSITIAVLGGTYIFGGRGRVSGTLLAIALVVVLTSGLQLAGVEDAWQEGILGVVLILSVVANNVFAARSGEER